ncbi:hypothetical protein [Sulfobacillus harzensis]|uniref:Lipoprotein n=1 Tax=Sulfobacillus harzensis TaxID=2729629 RepID=A0A7Y0L403_9FIRM|nr:hypothetical protein [Sulfobacillus harzensis]NMP22881.1 hypothetical protein [Sulfobacillus harzensis]
MTRQRQAILGSAAIIFLVGGCGWHAATPPTLASRSRPVHWSPVIRQAMAWVGPRTHLSLLAPTTLPHAPHTSAYGFATNNSYSVSVVKTPGQSLPFNDPKLMSGKTGTVLVSFSAVKIASQGNSVPVYNLLASYNMLGPSGLPPLSGSPVSLAGTTAHWSLRRHLLSAKRNQWMYLVEDSSRQAALSTMRSLLAIRGLPQQPGLVVVSGTIAMADFEDRGMVMSVAGQQSTPTQVLAMTKSFKPVPRQGLDAAG